MSNPQPTKPTDAQVLAGGEEVPICYRGQPVVAWVRQVTPRELLDYLRSEAEGEEAVLALVVRIEGEPEVDLDQVDLEGYEALIEADRRQNFTHARRREERETARAMRQLQQLRDSDPETYRKVQQMQGQALESLLSQLGPSVPEPGAGAKSPV